MQFQFEGETYRIAFRHPVPIDLIYHAKHEVELRQGTADIPDDGPARLMCAECEARTGRPVQLLPVPKDRNVECTIYICEPQENSMLVWSCVSGGKAKLNRKAKDRYTREGGRMASLNAALIECSNPEFRATALAAYSNRKGMVGQVGVIG